MAEMASLPAGPSAPPLALGEFMTSGGEPKGITTMLRGSRNQGVARMVAEAETQGASAIIAMRFDTSELGSTWTEICAYGTAVRVRHLP
ncbi:MAG: YbjQ family protein [Chloroflexi bacterium]|nr:YbjQ family protein [Chloroflexota bacterium]